ncbi:MAG TPA: hypothetical protein VGH44_01935 [Candidatus Saccharimonadia bacterium]
MKNILEFAVAVLNEWMALITGGIIAAVLWLIPVLKPDSFGAARQISYAAIVLAFAAACYRAWLKERDAVRALNESIADEGPLQHPYIFISGAGITSYPPHMIQFHNDEQHTYHLDGIQWGETYVNADIALPPGMERASVGAPAQPFSIKFENIELYVSRMNEKYRITQEAIWQDRADDRFNLTGFKPHPSKIERL